MKTAGQKDAKGMCFSEEAKYEESAWE